MKELESVIEKLNAQKEVLKERLERVDASLRKTHAKDWSEQAQERENDEVVEALGSNIRVELNQINEALDRVESGEYGKCAICDGPIRVARLEALPYTDRCLTCASELE
jgi:RNA polymerase-binding transcription factor